MAVVGSRAATGTLAAASAKATAGKMTRGDTEREMLRAAGLMSIRVLSDQLGQGRALLAGALVGGTAGGVDAGVEGAQGGATVAGRQGRLVARPVALEL